MFEKLSSNLNLLMAEARINASELARQIGLPASTIKKIRNHDNPNPTLTTLLPLAQFFGISVSELIGDEDFHGGLESGKQSVSYPLLTWDEVSHWPKISLEAANKIKLNDLHDKNVYALQVIEDNWEFSKGSILIIHPTFAPLHRDYVLVAKEGAEQPTIKQIYIDEDITYLKPIVQGYIVSKLTSKHRILGVVVECRKNLKIIKNEALVVGEQYLEKNNY